jgi:beta-lactamase regulating signal transducer with metallopeptidase domain
MYVLVGIALKSLLIAGIALGLLQLMKDRSASERSWVAHIGLLALVLLALAPLVLPNWNIAAPSLFGETQASQVAASPVTAAPTPAQAATSIAPAAKDIVAKAPAPRPTLSPMAAATALYAVPAAILLFITFLALGRLITLRARADVLVDGHWLSALARAQRRMGFKHGTALLTSDELASPISWGLMRPVILLNTRAVEAAGEAEAIIAHELAHVARMDWVKLLLARVATALFWFNPFVWVLAREAHQLREEAADDAVLAADIADTDYAQLLVGVARHECPGLLLGAHGVAPSKNSLARRVARVLDGKSVRGPVARSFAFGVLVGAVMIAAPLAALTLTPAGMSTLAPIQATSAKHSAAARLPSYYPQEAAGPTDLPSIIASGVTTAVHAVDAVAAVEPRTPQEAHTAAVAKAVVTASQARDVALAQASAATATARAVVMAQPSSTRDPRIDRVIQLKAVGVSPEYVDALRAAVPRLRNLDDANFTGLKAVGVTPEWAREMVNGGLRNIDVEELTSAKAVGLNGAYVRGMIAAGVRGSVDDFIELYAVGVRPSYVQELRRAGYVFRNVDQLVQMQALGVGPRDLKVMPRTSAPPRPPAVDADPDDDPDGG